MVNAKKVGIGTYANSYSAGGVAFTAVLGNPTNTAVTLSNDNGQTFYNVAATADTEDTQSLLTSKYGTCTVKVDASNTGNSQASLEDRLKSLAGNTVTVTVTAALYTPSQDTSAVGGKTYYTQDESSKLWSPVASPAGNPNISSYYEIVPNAVKLKKGNSITAHDTETYRAVDGGWANETVSYHTDIKVDPESGLGQHTIAEQTFVYGIDGDHVGNEIAASANQIQILATVTFAATGD